MTLSISLLALLSACSGPSQDSVVGHWRVMTQDKGKPDMLCYAGTMPIQSVSNVKDRAAPYLMITRRVSGKIEVSVSAGYPYKQGKRVLLVVDDNQYRLFSRNSVAWARNDSEDNDILFALRKAQNIEVKATAEAGGTSVDNYSPEGFAAALARVKHLCP